MNQSGEVVGSVTVETRLVPGLLVLVRHGESQFNADQRFTGLLEQVRDNLSAPES